MLEATLILAMLDHMQDIHPTVSPVERSRVSRDCIPRNHIVGSRPLEVED